jgi:xylan 1,4-beta-xylosidase
MSGSYKNPVIPGFYPDPSICRVGDDYYLATSSFEYFPGVPILHSRDLINWMQIGHAITRRSQLDLSRTASSHGIFAPTLRYHDGIFYMITTDVGGQGHFYLTTTDPAGEWSDPIYVEGTGFDPDLFFDDDGKVYFTRENFTEFGILQWQIDIASGKLMGEGHLIWEGVEDRLCEAPHIYKINGMYYLMVAEGGTHRGHMVMVGRSEYPWGPYEPAPHNPILTHRHRVMHHIQATGHADLVQTKDGLWWLVFLGIRQIKGSWHHLGRETFLAPVQWESGWPVINSGEAIELEMKFPIGTVLANRPQEALMSRIDTDFTSDFGLEWNFRGNPDNSWFSHKKGENGGLILQGTQGGLTKTTGCAFMGRRQCHFSMRAEMEFLHEPKRADECAGLAVLMNENHFYALEVSSSFVTVSITLGSLSVAGKSAGFKELPLAVEGRYRFIITSDALKYRFFVCDGNGNEIQLGSMDSRYVSTEVAGGFTGVYIGPYASVVDSEALGERGSMKVLNFSYTPMDSRCLK